MKKFNIWALLLITVFDGFGQQTHPSPTTSKVDYLKKSNNQKIVAYALLSPGVVLMTTGVILFDKTCSKGGDESIMILSGLVMTTVSIPFFISSRRNKKKAMSMAFINQSLPMVSEGSFVYKTIPSINIKMNF